MGTGNKNQIVLLIINFFSEIASLPLPNPIYHWNGLPLQKDINLHILEMEAQQGRSSLEDLEALPRMLTLNT